MRFERPVVLPEGGGIVDHRLDLVGSAGRLASLIAGEDERMGRFGNIAAGIVGVLIGGALFSALGEWESPASTSGRCWLPLSGR